MKDVMAFVKELNPFATIYEAIINNLSNLICWLCFLIDPECAWGKSYKLLEEYDALIERIILRQANTKLAAEIAQGGTKLGKEIVDDMLWFNTNSARLAAEPRLAKQSRVVDQMRSFLVAQHEIATSNLEGFKNRVQPLCIWFHGEPGKGKSEIIPIFRKAIVAFLASKKIAPWCDMVDNDGLVFSKASSSDFWDTYCGQPFCCLDDCMQVQNPEIVARQLGELITLINTAPAVLDMSKTHEKGKVRFTSRVVFVSSNVDDWSQVKTANPAALGRRISYAIEVKQKKKLEKGMSGMTLDELNEGWTFVVKNKIGNKKLSWPHSLEIPQYYDKFMAKPKCNNTEIPYMETEVCLIDLLKIICTELAQQSVQKTFSDRLVISEEDCAKFQCDGTSSSSEEWEIDADFGEVDSAKELVDLLSTDFESQDSSLKFSLKISPTAEDRAKKFEDAVPSVSIDMDFNSETSSTSDVTHVLKAFATMHQYVQDKTDLVLNPSYVPRENTPKGLVAPDDVFERNVSYSREIPSEYGYTSDFKLAPQSWIGSFFNHRKIKGSMYSDVDEAEKFLASRFDTIEGIMECNDAFKNIYHDDFLFNGDSACENAFYTTGNRNMPASYFMKMMQVLYGPSFAVAIWDRILTIAGGKGIDRLIFGGANGQFGFAENLNSLGRVNIVGIKEYVSRYEKNTLSMKFSFRIHMRMMFDADISLTALSASAALLVTGVVAVVTLVEAAGFAIPAVFQSSKKYLSRTGRKGMETTSRANQKEERLMKEISMHAYENTRNTGGNSYYDSQLQAALSKEKPPADFQSPGKPDAGKIYKIMHNCMVVKFHTDEAESWIYGHFMDDKTFVFPWHAYGMIQPKNDRVVKLEIFTDSPNEVKTCLVLNSGFTVFRFDKSRDAGCITFRKPVIPGLSALWGLLTSEEDFKDNKVLEETSRIIRGTVKDKVILRTEGPFESRMKVMTPKRHAVYNMDGDLYQDSLLSYYIIMEGEGTAGDCGFPYFSGAQNGFCFLGQHMARSGNDALVMPLFKEDKAKIANFNVKYNPDHTELQCMPPGAKKLVVPLDRPVPVINGAMAVGMWEGKKSASPCFSSMKVLLPEMVDEGRYGEIEVPAIINDTATLYRNEVTHNFGPTPHYVPDKLHDPDWAKGFANLPNKCRELTFEEACFGSVELNLPSMASSSKYVGPFFDQKKIELINFSTKFVDNVVRLRVAEYRTKLLSGKIIRPICQQFAKDELLPWEKVFCEQPCPRIINGHDLAYNIALRMTFGHLMNELMLHWSESSCCIGVNPLSQDWGMVANKSFKFPNIIQGDLSKQEATITQMFAQGFAAWCKSNYLHDEQWYCLIDNFCEGLSGYYFIRNGVLYMTIRGHSSGHLLTAIFNSWMVWAGHKLAFEELVPDEDFLCCVALCVMGDDSNGSVDDKVKDRYNMVTISKAFKDMFGMKYTSPDKTADGVTEPFMNDSTKLKFLGRGFVKDSSNEQIVGRLEKPTIQSILCYYTGKSGMKFKDELQARADAAFREMALYPKAEYDEMLEYYKDTMIKKLTPSAYRRQCPTLYSYASWRQRIFKDWANGGNLTPYCNFQF